MSGERVTVDLPRGPAASGLAAGLRRIVLLAGGTARSELAAASGRPAVTLPVGEGRTLLDVWAERLTGVANLLGAASLEVLVAVDRDAELGSLIERSSTPHVRFAAVRDGTEYRGTAGVIRDLTADVDPDDRILVAPANQAFLGDLDAAVRALDTAGEGVLVAPHGRGDHAALFLLRRERFERVPEIGYVDLKEQALPAFRECGPVRVVRSGSVRSMPLRAREDYLRILRCVHRPLAPAGAGGAYAEDWERSFAVIEAGAEVDPGAFVQDSVVLAGARVESGAVVARSVVCAGVCVRRGESAVERVLSRR